MSEFLKTQANANKRQLPAHERPRNWKGFFPKNKNCLPGIKRSYKNFQLVINELCENYNMLHSAKTRYCSIKNSKERKKFYKEFFSKVCKEFRIDPRDVKPKHIEWFFKKEIERIIKLNQSVSTIKKVLSNYLSILQFFSRMIGKYGIVQTLQHYLELVDEKINFEPPPVSKGQGISEEKVHEILTKIFKRNLPVGCQLLAMFAFGLRDREACGIRPQEDFIDKKEGDGTRRYLIIRPKAGSKGGKPRAIPFTNEFQYEAEALIKNFCKNLGWPELRDPKKSLMQAYNRINEVTSRDTGFNTKKLGITPYAFRHSFAQKYFGGIISSGVTQKESLKSTTLALGHYRERITGVYLNNSMRAGNKAMKKTCKSLLLLKPNSLEAITNVSSLIKEVFFYDWNLALALACLFAKSDSNLGSNPVFGVVLEQLFKGKSMPDGQKIIESVSTFLELNSTDVEEVICCYGGSIDIEDLFKNVLDPAFGRIIA